MSVIAMLHCTEVGVFTMSVLDRSRVYSKNSAVCYNCGCCGGAGLPAGGSMLMSERALRTSKTVLSSLHGCFAVRSLQVQALYCLEI